MNARRTGMGVVLLAAAALGAGCTQTAAEAPRRIIGIGNGVAPADGPDVWLRVSNGDDPGACPQTHPDGIRIRLGHGDTQNVELDGLKPGLFRSRSAWTCDADPCQNFLADVEITEVRDSVVLGSYRFLDPAGVPIARTVAFEARKCREPAPGG